MKTTHFKNTKISYTDQGKGSVVILLHGFLENSTMWKYLAPVLAKKNRVICIDLLGHGQTDCLGYIHSMEDMADAVHHVISELKIRKAVFVGHSMGGYVALAVAELYPEFMKGVVLLNSTSRADSDERIANRTRAIKAVKQNYIAAVRMSIANLFSEENRTKLSEQIEWVRGSASNAITRNYCRSGRHEIKKRPRSNFTFCNLSNFINFRKKRSCIKLRRKCRAN